jgi:hypothetical protein
MHPSQTWIAPGASGSKYALGKKKSPKTDLRALKILFELCSLDFLRLDFGIGYGNYGNPAIGFHHALIPHDAVNLGEQCIIFALTHVLAGPEFSAALAHQNAAGRDDLAAETLATQALTW